LQPDFSDITIASGLLHRIRRGLAGAVEYAKFESRFVKAGIGCCGLAVATVLRLARRRSEALRIETSLHRNAFFEPVDRVIEARVRDAIGPGGGKLEGYLENLQPQPATAGFFKDPTRLLGHRILALKSPAAGEKGVLILDYSFVLSLFAKFFDVERIAERYHLVLEPSWSGSCDRDVLAFAGNAFPVFVQNNEPRDIAFIERLGSNLVSVAIAANWWVDHRVFRPLPGVHKDADVLVNSAWARFKRHDALFAALARLRKRGERLKVLLVGYPMDLTREDIFQLAKLHGVSDQVELFERLKPTDVNGLLNRAKVNVIWSRREGSNRAIIEGFAAGVPGILRSGFNYGYHHPYINSATGSYATDRNLPDRLLEMVKAHERYDPRSWILESMSPQVATRHVDEAIARHAAQVGEKWTTGRLAVKVTSLDSMTYWDETERARFAPDHDFVRSALRAKR
jgi:glycosyltransferase involved in cell wall biosynthesis